MILETCQENRVGCREGEASAGIVAQTRDKDLEAYRRLVGKGLAAVR